MADSVGLRWYTTGTATTKANNTAVTGTSTNWKTAGIKPGDIFTTDRQVFYEIASVNSDTSITLAQAFTAANTNINYYIIRNFAATLQSELAAEISRQNAIYQTWMDGRVTEIGIEYQYYKQYKNAWASGVSYKALDIVMYNSALYVCSQAHTSSNSITPANTAYWTSYAPAMPSGVDVFNYNNAGSHNAIYRGKNLGTEPTAAQWAAINAGTFEDIYPGDYWQKEITFEYPDYTNEDALTSKTMTVAMYVAHIDYLYNYSILSNNNIHHIAIVPYQVLFQAPYHDTLNTGYSYKNCKIYTTYLEGALNAFKAFFGETHILPFKNLVPTNSTGSASEQTRSLDLLNEYMVFGHNIYGQPFQWNNNSQLNIFKFSRSFINTGTNDTMQNPYWLADLCEDGNNGTTTSTYGKYLKEQITTARGIRPFCLIRG